MSFGGWEFVLISSTTAGVLVTHGWIEPPSELCISKAEVEAPPGVYWRKPKAYVLSFDIFAISFAVPDI